MIGVNGSEGMVKSVLPCPLFQTEIYGVPLDSSSTESILLLYHCNFNVPLQTWPSYQNFSSSWFICSVTMISE
jgi:hypothetical protein